LEREDPDFANIANDHKEIAINLFESAINQEKSWADYLFKDGSMLGLNKEILWNYIDYIARERMKAVDLPPLTEVKTNPLPWMLNWLNSATLQVAPQETAITSYVAGGIKSDINVSDLKNFEL
jgi:ribonucleoside-diphosphate reductase beta chain